MTKKSTSHVFYIQGIHCSACEMLIKETLDDCVYIENFELNATEKKVTIIFNDARFIDEKLALFFVQKLFKGTDYTFSLTPIKTKPWPNILFGIGIAIVILLAVYLLNQQNILTTPQLDNNSGLAAFFIFGFLASISSCAVLVGGIILALAQTWFKKDQSKWQPILGFQVGRVVSFAVGGLILGLIGSFFKVNYLLNAILLMVVSVLMILSGLNFMGVKIWRQKGIKFQKIKAGVATTWWWPTVVGMATFFIPCGFTATVQLLVLTAPSPGQAALMMIAFVLGTVPVLSVIAYGGSLGCGGKRWHQIINYALGALIIALGLMNLNTQLQALNLPSFNGQIFAQSGSGARQNDDLVPMDGEVQVIKLTATPVNYQPSKIRIRADVPTRLEVEVTGVSGCSNAIIAPDFFEGRLELKRGEVAVKEFVAPAAGKYKITCWMEMITVAVEVI